MADTLLTDGIIPEVYLSYFHRYMTDLDAFVQSGVIGAPPDFTFPTNGGEIVQVPYWDPLAGDDEIYDDTQDITINSQTSGKMQARMHVRQIGYGRSDLVAMMTGSDPHESLAEKDARKWISRRQAMLLASLKGFFTTAGAANTFDISALTGGAEVIDGAATMDAAQRLGDAKGALTAFAMHSATETALSKQGLIDYIDDADGNSRVPFYQQKRVIVDDNLPVDTDVYTSYLFGTGAVSYVSGSPTGITEIESNRVAARGIDQWIRRVAFFLHINGTNWAESSVAGPFPTNTELEAAANWTLWDDPKNVRIVQFKHKNA